MQTLRRPIFAVVCSLCLVALVGCGESISLQEVSGVVTLDGKPLELIHVEFWPEAGPRSLGKTDEQGRFTLELDDRSAMGAVAGSHKVSLKDTWPSQDDYIGEGGAWVDMSKGRRSRIHTKYYDAPTSPLTVQVKAGEVNSIDFAVDPKKK